jgi:cyclin-dependent kinase
MHIPNLDELGLDLLDGLLVYDPSGRMSAKQACGHEYFKGMHIMPNGSAGSFSYIGDGLRSNGFH